MQTLRPETAQSLAVTGASAAFATPVVKGLQGLYYAYACDVPSWIAQSDSAPVASVGGAGCVFVPAATLVYLDAHCGTAVAAIRSGATSGTASLTRVSMP